MATFREMNERRAEAVRARYGGQKYTPVALENLSNKELRSELSKARSILRKRYQRAAEMYRDETKANIARLLTPIRDIPVSAMPEVLSEMARMLSAGYTTLSGAAEYQENAVENFRNAGYDFINNSNIRQFLDFADEFSWKEKDKLYGSGVLLKYFNHQSERIARGDAVKISRRSFLRWLAEQE